MKKKVLLIAALFTVGLSFAQDGLTSKKGVPILPEAGDFAIGFDAGNMLMFGGNLLNGDQNNAFNPLGNLSTNTIYGKYFIDANKAVRGMLRIGYRSETDRFLVQDFGSFLPNATTEDEFTYSELNITIGGGFEMRRGKGRLQGVYGPIAMVTIGSGIDTTANYGNDLTLFGAGSVRQTKTNSGGTFGVDLGGFAGVEYFFAPKMSIGGEIMWTVSFANQANGENSFEVLTGGLTTTIKEDTGGGTSTLTVDTRPMTNISINFHF